MRTPYLDYVITAADGYFNITKPLGRRYETKILYKLPSLDFAKRVCIIDFMIERPGYFRDFILKRIFFFVIEEEFDKFKSVLKQEGIMLPPEISKDEKGQLLFNNTKIIV